MRIEFSFDDGAKLDLKVVELLQKHGIKDAIFYIPSDWQSYNLREGRDPLSLEDVLEISKLYEIGSHTVTHPMLTRIPMHQVEWELRESKQALEELLGKEVKSFCYPRGYANDEIRDLAGKYYKTARNTLVGTNEPSEDPLWQSTSVHIGGKRRKEYEGTTWQHQAKRMLEEGGTVFHAWGHSWEIERYKCWEDFENLLRMVT